MEMELPSTFQYEGWTIRYGLLKPGNRSGLDLSQLKCIVFVHGTPWSSVVYQPLIEALLARGSYRLLVYDLPGYGQSQQLDYEHSKISSKYDFPGDTSVSFQSKTLAALLKHVELDGKRGHPTPAVLAHDIAGTIVLRAHLLHDCDFDTMMLIDANAVLPWGDGFHKVVRSEPRPYVDMPPNIFEAVVRAVIRSACYNLKVLQAGWEDTLAHPWIQYPHRDTPIEAQDRQQSFVRQIAQADDSDVAEMLDGNMYQHVRCDVKIVWGEEDQWIPRSKIEDLTKRLGGKLRQSAYIPNAGHLVMLDQPTRFAVEVFDRLTRFGSSWSLKNADATF